jgi:hypothetical protein
MKILREDQNHIFSKVVIKNMTSVVLSPQQHVFFSNTYTRPQVIYFTLKNAYDIFNFL